jgi:uncharacterized protein YqgV (UPF0045/DUF77 family)
MRVAVDISLYPLTEEYLTPIRDVIHRLKQHESVDVETNPMSTQIRGEYDAVMNVLHAEMKQTFEQVPKAVFVMRILNNPLNG